MSFFFDVLTEDGFVLASDVRRTEHINEEEQDPLYAHKIFPIVYSNHKVKCAIAICGDDPDVCKCDFYEACALRDTLRDIAQYFAIKWTGHFAGQNIFSAVHLVGYEIIPNSDELVPQLWYWHSWESDIGYLTEDRLHNELSSFSDLVPANNHLPWLIKEKTGQPLPATLQAERSLVMDYLCNTTIFTWNGDIAFWQSAANIVHTVIEFIRGKKPTWNIEDTVRLIGLCLEFLAKMGNLLPESTVGLSPEGKYDVLVLTPQETKSDMASLPIITAQGPNECALFGYS